MKKLHIFEMLSTDIDKDGNVCEISQDYRIAHDLWQYRKSICEKYGCANHYEIVKIKFTDDTNTKAYFGVLDTSKNTLI